MQRVNTPCIHAHTHTSPTLPLSPLSLTGIHTHTHVFTFLICVVTPFCSILFSSKNWQVFDVCPCERAAAFDAGTCAFGLGLLLGAASAVSMFIATGMECLLRDTRTRQVYPISDEERMFYE